MYPLGIVGRTVQIASEGGCIFFLRSLYRMLCSTCLQYNDTRACCIPHLIRRAICLVF